MVVFSMAELLLVNPDHFVSLPSVPLPVTGRGPAAIGVIVNTDAAGAAKRLADIKLKPALLYGRACAGRAEDLNSAARAWAPTVSSVFEVCV
jgi:hypothetical protein